MILYDKAIGIICNFWKPIAGYSETFHAGFYNTSTKTRVSKLTTFPLLAYNAYS